MRPVKDMAEQVVERILEYDVPIEALPGLCGPGGNPNAGDLSHMQHGVQDTYGEGPAGEKGGCNLQKMRGPDPD